MVHRAFIALGSNLGDRLSHLQQALSLLGGTPGVELIKISSLYETEPVGMKTGEPAGAFLNAVTMVETILSARELLAICGQIEKHLGRNREQEADKAHGYSSRTLDLDILFYDQAEIHDDKLDLPHPRLQERAFVMVPLLEIAPDWVHPVFGKTIRQLALSLPESGAVRLFRESDFPAQKQTEPFSSPV